jgi:hypothetical protein
MSHFDQSRAAVGQNLSMNSSICSTYKAILTREAEVMECLISYAILSSIARFSARCQHINSELDNILSTLVLYAVSQVSGTE